MEEFYYDNKEECIERRIDGDLPYAVRAMGSDNGGFRLEDVAYVLAYLSGENDGPSYHWIIAMKDHTYAYVTGWCDYTGWGCQDGGNAKMFPSLREALADTDASVENLLKLQLTGENSFGESTPESEL